MLVFHLMNYIIIRQNDDGGEIVLKRLLQAIPDTAVCC